MSRTLLALAVTLTTFAHAADWPRFRGPNGTGVAADAPLPDKVGPSQNVIWKTTLPPGHSSPVIVGDRIFVTAFEGEKLLTMALNRTSGKVLWRKEAPRDRQEKLDKQNSPASPTPVADGKNVYVFFPDYGLLSYTVEGVPRWAVRLGPFHNTYGMGSSPVLAGDKVVLICDQSLGSFAVAFSQADGKQIWKTPRPEAVSGHSTPIVYQPKDGPTEIIAPGSFRMDAYDLQTGKTVWYVNGLASEMKSVPVLDGDMIYINGYNAPFNDPGKQVTFPPFDEALATFDKDKDGFLSKDEVPAGPAKTYFEFNDLNGDGKLDAGEWKMMQAVFSAENGLLAIRAGGSGDTSSKAFVWKYHKSIPQLPSTLLYRGVIYIINDGGVMTTVNPATGEAYKQARLRGAIDKYYASPVAADGKVFVIGLSGVLTILKAGPEQEILSVNELDDESYATPAIADSRLYVRTRGTLYCFGL
jgi:outer membrane protein assembly factor BamB